LHLPTKKKDKKERSNPPPTPIRTHTESNNDKKERGLAKKNQGWKTPKKQDGKRLTRQRLLGGEDSA